MKKVIKTTLVLILFSILSNAYSQNFVAFSKSLKEGNIDDITVQLDEDVEVTILNDDTYSKTSAEPLIANFFSGKGLTEYKAIHKGTTSESAYYQIGQLKSNNETYRTYMYSKKKDGHFLIQEFRIEKI